MQAVQRLARQSRAFQRSARCLATAAAGNPVHVTSYTSSSNSVIPLSNIEAQWARLSSEEQVSVNQQLEELQKKDWKELSIDEKKAAFYVAFGEHGPRAPVTPPGSTTKVLAGTAALIGAAGVLFMVIRHNAPEPPKTMTHEWQEASNERAKELNLNPITGISSEGYAGKGFISKQ